MMEVKPEPMRNVLSLAKEPLRFPTSIPYAVIATVSNDNIRLEIIVEVARNDPIWFGFKLKMFFSVEKFHYHSHKVQLDLHCHS